MTGPGHIRQVIIVRGGFRTRYRMRWVRVLLAMVNPRTLWQSWIAQLEMLTEAQHMEDLQRVCPHEPGMLDWHDDGQWAHCRGCSGVVSAPVVHERWTSPGGMEEIPNG